MKNKSSPTKSNLPSVFAAHRFVCGCFGIEEDDLNQNLDRLHKANANSPGFFPPRVSRPMLMRAEQGQGRFLGALIILHQEALYDRIRRSASKPLFSRAGKVAEETAFALLRLYEKLIPRLSVENLSAQNVLWVLVENVFVPTLYASLLTHWRLGLGTELRGDLCWYLPLEVNSQTQMPIARVLDCWLRVAGFRTAYGVSQSFSDKREKGGSKSDQYFYRWNGWKKSVGRWLNGTPVRSICRLHELVDEFKEQVAWLDDSDSWKARFMVANATQEVCDRMDAFFNPVRKNASQTLAPMLRKNMDENLVLDDEGQLLDLSTFFAVRLLQLCMRKNGEWERHQLDPCVKPANAFLEYVKAVAHLASCSCTDVVNSQRDWLFEFGVSELNRLLAAKRKGASKH